MIQKGKLTDILCPEAQICARAAVRYTSFLGDRDFENDQLLNMA
jgi:hypothetical protein